MTVSDKARNLDHQLDTATDEIKPARDLWPGIELAIAAGPATEHKPSRKWQVGIAAGLLVPAVLIGFMWLNGNPAQQNNAFTGVVAQLSEQYETQKASMLVAYQNQNAVTNNWQEQLSELESAANAIKAALEEDPNNLALVRMLQSVYQQQIDLIERVHAPKWQQI